MADVYDVEQWRAIIQEAKKVYESEEAKPEVVGSVRLSRHLQRSCKDRHKGRRSKHYEDGIVAPHGLWRKRD